MSKGDAYHHASAAPKTDAETWDALVDRLLGQQEIFTRPLRHPLTDLRGISGSCLLGNGQIVFIVDPAACVGRLYTEN